MSMSTNIRAFIPDTNPEFQKHKKILLLCAESGVSLPKETAEYFDSEDADEYLLDEKLEIQLKKGVHYVEYHGDAAHGFEVDLLKLPDGVTKLRFYNSW